MLELRIISPQENGFVQEIEWNNEELKTAIAKKMEDYKGLVFTEETIADGKKDRADLNKLRGAIDNERKRIKKMCMEPYDKFEKEVKEVLGLVDEQINAIDVQIKEVEQIKREEKRKTVQELFESIGFQKFVTLEMIWDEKWLNASVSLSKVENRKYEEKELEIIHKTDKPQYDIYKLNLCTKKDSALQNPFCIACVILYDVCNLQVSLRISPEIICRNIPCYDILPNRQSLRYSCQSTQADVPHVPAGSAGHKRNR